MRVSCGNGLITQAKVLTTKKKKAFRDIVGNRENAGNQHFLHFPQCFRYYLF